MKQVHHETKNCFTSQVFQFFRPGGFEISRTALGQHTWWELPPVLLSLDCLHHWKEKRSTKEKRIHVVEKVLARSQGRPGVFPAHLPSQEPTGSPCFWDLLPKPWTKGRVGRCQRQGYWSSWCP